MTNRLVMLSCVLALSCGVASAGPFVNGSFENGTFNPSSPEFNELLQGSTAMSGWTVFDPVDSPTDLQCDASSIACVDWIGTYWNAAHGTKSLDLNGRVPGGVQQTFDTIAGVEYVVQFSMSGHPLFGPSLKTAVGTVGGAPQLFNFTIPVSPSSGPPFTINWVEKQFSFIASGTSTTLQFYSTTTGASGWPATDGKPTTAFGPALDNVRVTAVPEPTSMLFLGSGLLMAARRLRRRS